MPGQEKCALSRRALIVSAAALPAATVPLAAMATSTGGLMGLERERVAKAAIVNATRWTTDEEAAPFLEEVWRLEDRIVEAPCACAGDARAKLLTVQRSFTEGEKGDEAQVLQQVIDWLTAGGL